MTHEEREAVEDVCGYLESLLDDCIARGLPQDIAADIRLSIAQARKFLGDHS